MPPRAALAAAAGRKKPLPGRRRRWGRAVARGRGRAGVCSPCGETRRSLGGSPRNPPQRSGRAPAPCPADPGPPAAPGREGELQSRGGRGRRRGGCARAAPSVGPSVATAPSGAPPRCPSPGGRRHWSLRSAERSGRPPPCPPAGLTAPGVAAPLPPGWQRAPGVAPRHRPARALMGLAEPRRHGRLVPERGPLRLGLAEQAAGAEGRAAGEGGDHPGREALPAGLRQRYRPRCPVRLRPARRSGGLGRSLPGPEPASARPQRPGSAVRAGANPAGARASHRGGGRWVLAVPRCAAAAEGPRGGWPRLSGRLRLRSAAGPPGPGPTASRCPPYPRAPGKGPSVFVRGVVWRQRSS